MSEGVTYEWVMSHIQEHNADYAKAIKDTALMSDGAHIAGSTCACNEWGVSQVTWLVHVCDMTHSYMWHDAFIYDTWRIHICDMTHSYMWHDAFIYVTWRIHICDMTHSYMWHDPCMLQDPPVAVTNAACSRCHDSCVRDMPQFYMWHDSFVRDTCDTTRLRWWVTGLHVRVDPVDPAQFPICDTSHSLTPLHVAWLRWPLRETQLVRETN